MSFDPQIVSFADVLAVRETAKAIGCIWLGHTQLFWVPKSQLQNGTQVAHLGDQGALVVSEWWARTSKVHLNFEATE
jgi:hypothetical protein